MDVERAFRQAAAWVLRRGVEWLSSLDPLAAAAAIVVVAFVAFLATLGLLLAAKALAKAAHPRTWLQRLRRRRQRRRDASSASHADPEPDGDSEDNGGRFRVDPPAVLKRRLQREAGTPRSTAPLPGLPEDPDVLYRKGRHIGAVVRAASLPDLCERLREEDVCRRATFHRKDGGGLPVLRLEGTRTARALRRAAEPACHVEAGVLAATLESVTGLKELRVVERKCGLQSGGGCVFETTGGRE